MNINNNVLNIMGILNGTPDSFYKNSRIDNINSIRDDYKYADILDVGFESTRPGAASISINEELSRLEDFLENHIKTLHHRYSIDTYKPEIAKIAINNGFSLINDITGAKSGKMFEVASEYKCPIVIMHMQGVPQSMQENPYYENIIDELLYYFENRIKIALDYGLDISQIILDPGIGFGKRVIDNDKIINNISKLKKLGFPILIGLSRNSFLRINNDTAEERLPATIGVTALAINNGADIIRTHDIKDVYRMSKIVNRVVSN